jgi:hypothetical protein
MGQVTKGLAEAIKNVNTDGGAFKSFTEAQLLELGRVILTQVAKTPGMLGVNRSEVQSIIAGVAEAMAADKNLLLSAEEWIRIIGIAAQKAAANPGRLFGLSAVDDPASALAVKVITAVLKVAGDNWTAAGRSAGTLFFGDTLGSALETVIKALSGNVAAVTKNPELVDQFLNSLLTRASANPQKFGSDGLLKVMNACIGNVLANGTLPDDEEIDRIV